MATAITTTPGPGNKSHIQQDWEHREFIENISISILKLTEFLNRFDLSMRSKLAEINEKLSHLERKVEFAEAIVNNALQQQ